MNMKNTGLNSTTVLPVGTSVLLLNTRYQYVTMYFLHILHATGPTQSPSTNVCKELTFF
jgi:flagellar biosynthesis protein FliP